MAKPVTKKLYEYVWVQLFVAYLILSPIGSCIYDKTKNIPVITPILKAFSFVWNDVLNFNIPLWIIVIIIFLAILFTRNHFVFKEKLMEMAPPYYPVLNYTQGILKVWKWKWKYRNNVIIDLTPICPKCDVGMIEYYYGSTYKCPKCDMNYSSHDRNWGNKNDIAALIIDNLEKGNYPK